MRGHPSVPSRHSHSHPTNVAVCEARRAVDDPDAEARRRSRYAAPSAPVGDDRRDRRGARRRLRPPARRVRPRWSHGAQRPASGGPASGNRSRGVAVHRSCARVPGRLGDPAVPRRGHRAGTVRRARDHGRCIGNALRDDHRRARASLRRARLAMGCRGPGVPLRLPELGRVRHRRDARGALGVRATERSAVGDHDRGRRRGEVVPGGAAPTARRAPVGPRRSSRGSAHRHVGRRRFRRVQPADPPCPSLRLVVGVRVPEPPASDVGNRVVLRLPRARSPRQRDDGRPTREHRCVGRVGRRCDVAEPAGAPRGHHPARRRGSRGGDLSRQQQGVLPDLRPLARPVLRAPATLAATVDLVLRGRSRRVRDRVRILPRVRLGLRSSRRPSAAGAGSNGDPAGCHRAARRAGGSSLASRGEPDNADALLTAA